MSEWYTTPPFSGIFIVFAGDRSWYYLNIAIERSHSYSIIEESGFLTETMVKTLLHERQSQLTDQMV